MAQRVAQLATSRALARKIRDPSPQRPGRRALAEDASHLEAKWTARLKEVSAKLVTLPREDPPEGPAFYAMKNPIDGKSNERKLEQLRALRH